MTTPANYRVALYARVSTHNGQDPELQLRELREYCVRRKWLIAEEYIDAGISGSKDSRPALNRLIADGCQARFDGVLCWRYCSISIRTQLWEQIALNRNLTPYTAQCPENRTG